MRKTIALVMVAALALSIAPVYDDEAFANHTRPKHFKKWCKNHKKKCKRVYRPAGSNHIVTSRTVVTGYTLEGEEVGREVTTAKHPGFWSSNGRVPGTKKKRGCGRITKQSVSEGYSWPVHLTHYRMSLSKYWCWKKGKIVRGSVSAHGSFPYIDNFIDKKNQKQKGDYYRWRAEVPRSGHYTFFDAYLKACINFIWEACTSTYYPLNRRSR